MMDKMNMANMMPSMDHSMMPSMGHSMMPSMDMSSLMMGKGMDMSMGCCQQDMSSMSMGLDNIKGMFGGMMGSLSSLMNKGGMMGGMSGMHGSMQMMPGCD